MHDIQYFLARPEDVAILTDYRVAFLEEYGGRQPDEAVAELKIHFARYFATALQNGTYICWFAKAGNEIAGIGGLVIREQPGNFKNPTGKVGYILSMYTVPAYRRTGIARNILERLTGTAKEMGITTFELHATKDGEPVYIKGGFELHKEPTYRKYEY